MFWQRLQTLRRGPRCGCSFRTLPQSSQRQLYERSGKIVATATTAEGPYTALVTWKRSAVRAGRPSSSASSRQPHARQDSERERRPDRPDPERSSPRRPWNKNNASRFQRECSAESW